MIGAAVTPRPEAPPSLRVPCILEPGWYPGLELEAYLAIPAMSASGMEAFRRSPAHYRYEQTHPKEPTLRMREGTALHLALLEPHLFRDRYVALGQCAAVKKSGERCTNQGIVTRGAPFDSAYCGVHDPAKGEPMTVEVLPADSLARLEGMRRSVLDHPEAREFFRGKGNSEVVGVWRDETTGVLCKLRLDRDIGRAAIHADLKSCPDASVAAFPKHAARMGYVHKSAWYRRGMAALGREAIGSVLIAVEDQPPHGCQTFLCREDQLEAIDRTIDRNLTVYAECLETDNWPAYSCGLRDLSLPPWELPDADINADNGDNDNEWGSDE